MKARNIFLWVMALALGLNAHMHADEHGPVSEETYHESSEHRFITLILHGWNGSVAGERRA
jgi:hypothetical protein